MASIPGSHFNATAPNNQTVNVVETSGGSLPPPQPGAFNLEIWTGNPADAPNSPANGYDGLAVLSNGGQEINLIAGTFSVTDNGTGQDTIDASGQNETIAGGLANVTLNLFGDNDVANGGGQDTITTFGNADTVNGKGNDLIDVLGDHTKVNTGSGNDTINLFGSHDVVNGGTGNVAINAYGDAVQINSGTGNQVIGLFGDHFDLDHGSGNETVDIFGSHGSADLNTGNAVVSNYGDDNTITGGVGNETVQVVGDDNNFISRTGRSTISVQGSHDTVEGGDQTGFSLGQITVGGDHFQFEDSGTHPYSDTIMGFDQTQGDRIHLTTESVNDALADSHQVNNGHDTLITLDDGSTILLKGVAHIDHSFFS